MSQSSKFMTRKSTPTVFFLKPYKKFLKNIFFLKYEPLFIFIFISKLKQQNIVMVIKLLPVKSSKKPNSWFKNSQIIDKKKFKTKYMCILLLQKANH